jgi:hypothetical protein
MTRNDPFELEKERKAKAAKLTVNQRDIENDVYNVMSTESGRRFVHQLLSECGVYRTSFNTNALAMAFAEGQRNVGLMLQSRVLKSCPQFYEQMIKEDGGDN